MTPLPFPLCPSFSFTPEWERERERLGPFLICFNCFFQGANSPFLPPSVIFRQWNLLTLATWWPKPGSDKSQSQWAADFILVTKGLSSWTHRSVWSLLWASCLTGKRGQIIVFLLILLQGIGYTKETTTLAFSPQKIKIKNLNFHFLKWWRDFLRQGKMPLSRCIEIHLDFLIPNSCEYNLLSPS